LSCYNGFKQCLYKWGGTDMKKGYLYIFLATILFSSMEVALKLFSNSFHPLQVNFLRFLIGAVILLPPAISGLKKRSAKLNRSDLLFFALTGFLCIVVSMGLYQMAILYSTATTVAVLFSCNPVFVLFFAYLLLKEKIYSYNIISIVICIAGILVIADPLKLSESIAGCVLTVLAALMFALYNVVGRTRSAKYGGIAFTCFSFVFGCLELLLLISLTHAAPVAALLNGMGLHVFAYAPIFAGLTPETLPGLAYIGIFVTGLGYTFYFLAIEETSAVTASVVFNVKPVLAPILALLILRESIPALKVAGIFLIVIGSLVSLVPNFMTQKRAQKLSSSAD
jgi:drug/metabolite transporter (DMT)-like permease